MGLRVESTLPPETEELISRTIAAAIEVHRHLGPGFIESIYEKAMRYELQQQGIPFRSQQEIVVKYKALEIEGQRLDLIVGEQLIVELKVVEGLGAVHTAQILSYMKATRIRAGLLINFREYALKNGLKRVVL